MPPGVSSASVVRAGAGRFCVIFLNEEQGQKREKGQEDKRFLRNFCLPLNC